MMQVVDILCVPSTAQHCRHQIVERLRSCARGQQQRAPKQRRRIYAIAARLEAISSDSWQVEAALRLGN